MKNKKLVLLSTSLSCLLVSCLSYAEVGSQYQASFDESSSETSSSQVVSSSEEVSSESTNQEKTYKLDFNVISPKGAPSLAYSRYLRDSFDKVTIAAPTNVIASFSSTDNQAIIFDAIKGCNFIQSQGKKYKLVTMVTSGNAFMIGTGHKAKDAEFAPGDKVVSFGTNSLFTKIAKTIYGFTNIDEVADVSTALTVAKTGLLEGENVDYVILSEPFVSNLFATETACYLKSDVKSDYYTYSKEQGNNNNLGFNGFPQAGLFISEDLENDETKAQQVEDLISTVKEVGEDLANNNAQESLKWIKEDVNNNLYNPTDLFTMDYTKLSTCLDSTKNVNKITNPLAFNYENYDLNSFLTEAGIEGFKPFNDSVFSKYYK